MGDATPGASGRSCRSPEKRGGCAFAVTIRLAGGLAITVSATDVDGAPAAFGASISASLAVADPATCSFDDLAGTFRAKSLPPSNSAADFRLESPSSRFFLRDAPSRRIFIMSGAGSRRVRATAPALVEYGGDSSHAMLAIAVRDESAMPIDASSLRKETDELQGRIDALAASGGGTLSIPPGVHLSGALFFKPGVNLHLEEGAVLFGANDASDYPMRETRLGGKTQRTYRSLVGNIRVRCPALHAARAEERSAPDYCDVRDVSVQLHAIGQLVVCYN